MCRLAWMLGGQRRQFSFESGFSVAQLGSHSRDELSRLARIALWFPGRKSALWELRIEGTSWEGLFWQVDLRGKNPKAGKLGKTLSSVACDHGLGQSVPWKVSFHRLSRRGPSLSNRGSSLGCTQSQSLTHWISWRHRLDWSQSWDSAGFWSFQWLSLVRVNSRRRSKCGCLHFPSLMSCRWTLESWSNPIH